MRAVLCITMWLAMHTGMLSRFSSFVPSSFASVFVGVAVQSTHEKLLDFMTVPLLCCDREDACTLI